MTNTYFINININNGNSSEINQSSTRHQYIDTCIKIAAMIH